VTSEAPHAPWVLGGECLVAMVRPSAPLGDLPDDDLRRVPGPCPVTAARYDDSPVGPYRELAVGQPARLGCRLGVCITTMAVTSVDSRLGGRVNWGFPKELGTLVWLDEGEDRVMRWEERDIVVRASPVGRYLPVLLPLRALQRRADGMVSVTPGAGAGSPTWRSTFPRTTPSPAWPAAIEASWSPASGWS
jgi:hypothetical protein